MASAVSSGEAFRSRPPSVGFLVNGGAESPMGLRAREFERRLRDEHRIAIAFRGSNRLRSIREFLRFLRRERPDVTYVFDMGYSGIVAAMLYKVMSRTPVVVDTGDAIFQLARSGGLRGPLALSLTWLLEKAGFSLADRVVVRGTKHRQLLARSGIDAVVIPDGVDMTTFRPHRDASLREHLGLTDSLSVGVLGSLAWSHRLGFGYGWELVEALRLLRGESVKGVIIGSGPGQEILRARAGEYGIADRIAFVGAVPFEALPAYIGSVDIWLSTQTNDVPGNVRTTGKLPLYLAADAFILASDVGEASLVLPPEMLVEYNGVVDTDYPARVAERIRGLLSDPGRLELGGANASRAREFFDYAVLAERVRAVLASALRKQAARSMSNTPAA